jgi:uncharacterized protein
MARVRAASLAALLVLVALVSGPPGAWAQTFPKLTGRVVDAANIIPDDEEARLTQKLEALEKQSKRQLVVATIPDLQGYEIADYGYRLGRAWGIGQKGTNNGAILIIAPKERKIRIEVGYGLESTLTDGMSFLIINNDIRPRFKADDYAGGIEAGTDAIIKQLTLPSDEARKIAAEADADFKNRRNDVSPGTVIFILFVIFFFVLPIIRSATRGGRRGRYGGIDTPIIWFPPSSGGSNWGGGSGWGGGGGSDSGGFFGGGGDFGGGGASGDW